MILKRIRSIVIGVFVVSLMVAVSILLNNTTDNGSVMKGRMGGRRRSQEEGLDEEERVSVRDGQMFEVLEQLYHDKNHFTQGLTYSNGVLYESIGLYGRSEVCQLNPDTAKAKHCVSMEQKYFAEGMQVYKDGQDDEEEKLIQLTWKSQVGFIRNVKTLDVIQEFKFTTTKNEGWGITYDASQHEFIVSDGSPFLHFWDATTLKEKRKVKVTRQNGGKADDLNELEFVNGRVLANVWHSDVILVIHPESGECLKEYDFSMLYPYMERRKQRADVLNGISVSDEEDVLYITGKFWDRMFKVKLLNKPPPTSSPTSQPTLPPTYPPTSEEDDTKKTSNDSLVIIQPSSPGNVSNNGNKQDDDFLGNDDRVYDTVNNSGNDNNNKNDDTSSLLDEKIINDILDSTDGDDTVVNSNTNIGNDTTDNNTWTTPSDTFAVDDDTIPTENMTQLVDTFFNSTTSNEDTTSKNNTTTENESKSGKNEISSNSTTSDDTQDDDDDDDDISVGNGTITTNSTLGDVGNKTLNQNTTEENSDTDSDHIVSLDDIAKQIEEEKNSTLSLETNHTTTMNSTEIIEEEMKSAEEKINSSENGTRF